MSTKTKGFTLLEILIALAIFAVLATITSQALRLSLSNRAQLMQQNKRLHDIQLTFSRVSMDILQTTNRFIHGDDMRVFPAFIGQPTYIELTRGGESNINTKQSHLSRVGYLCRQNQLIRRSFRQVDSLKRNAFEEEVLLDNLTMCRFAFINHASQVLPIWRGGELANSPGIEPLPKAVQLKLKLNDWGEVVSLFMIPEAMYAQLNPPIPTPSPPPKG